MWGYFREIMEVTRITMFNSGPTSARGENDHQSNKKTTRESKRLVRKKKKKRVIYKLSKPMTEHPIK